MSAYAWIWLFIYKPCFINVYGGNFNTHGSKWKGAAIIYNAKRYKKEWQVLSFYEECKRWIILSQERR